MAQKKKTAKRKEYTAKKTARKKPVKPARRELLSAEKSAQERRIRSMENELRILKQVGEITRAEFDFKGVLGMFLDVVMEATSTEAGSLLVVDKVSDTLSFAVARGKKAAGLKNVRLQMGEGIAGWVARSGKPLITPDVKKDRRFNEKISKKIKYKTRNILCVPLKFDDEVLGVIELLNKKNGKAFDESDLEIVRMLTPYISIVTKNAGLLIENRLRINRLEHIMEITKFVNSTLDLDELLNKMLENSTKMMNAEAGSILLLDDNADEMYFAAATGSKKDRLKEIRVPIGEGIAGWVAREGKSVLIADAQNDPRFFKNADRKSEFVTLSMIAVPLKTKDRLIGVVEVLNKISSDDNGVFTTEDMNLLEALSNQAAVAIENAKLYRNLKTMFVNTVKSLAAAIETKDIYTRGHSERVAFFSILIAKALDFKIDEVEDLRLAALLHDIGKIGVDESILRKPASLTDVEFEEVKKHPDYAANIIESIPQLGMILPVIRHHHERYDGKGYPSSLAGEEIPYYSRIIAIADTFDAMSSSRPYRQALPVSACIKEIKKCAGTQFDPTLAMTAVKAFKKHFEQAKKDEAGRKKNKKTKRRNK